MTPLDQKTELHYRQCAMNMALSTHEAQPQRTADETLATADRYFKFLSGNVMSAPTTDLPHVVAFPPPSGLPADTIDGVFVADWDLAKLQAFRRQQLFEMTTVANAIKAHGAVPC